ncbi:MAG: preprotein translocase subunit SecG [Bacteroidota bacterium]
MILFVILILLASVILGFIVLVQNPKGGGLSGSIAGFSNQFMGVKQTTDVLEKGTWIFAIIIGLLCLFSATFIPKASSGGSNLVNELDTKPKTTQPAPAPRQSIPPPSTQKK